MIRAFFALSVSQAVEQALSGDASMLRQQLCKERINWIPPENYHVTLVFLGAVHQRDIAELAELTQAVAARHRPQRLTVEDWQWFPGVHKPRLLVATLSLPLELKRLQSALQQQLNRRGYRSPRQKFRPHISVARAGRGQSPMAFDAPAAGLSFEADELVLFKSELHPQGARYTPLCAELIGG